MGKSIHRWGVLVGANQVSLEATEGPTLSDRKSYSLTRVLVRHAGRLTTVYKLVCTVHI